MTQLHAHAALLGTVRIRYIDASGKTYDIEANEGETLMQVATRNMVKGITGDCGGNCACGTCMVQLDDGVLKYLPQPDTTELEILEFSGDTSAGHRLGCQITLTPELDGVTVIAIGAGH